MRHLLATAAAIGLMTIASASTGAADAAERADPHLLTLGQLRAARSGRGLCR